MSVLENTSRVSFGLFEADLHTGELWKAGFRIRLQGQPFRVLAALLNHPGEVITREELHDQIWGPETNVDFDRALAGAINKIRDALGDSAENPVFIETLSKRGYRFIAPVQVLHRHGPDENGVADRLSSIETSHGVNGADHRAPAHPTEEPSLAPSTEAPAAASLSARRRWTPLETILTVALIGLLACLGITLASRPIPTSPPRLEQLTYNSPISPGPPNSESLPTLATDGYRVFTSVLANGTPQLSSISTATGAETAMPLPKELASIALADLSKDGTSLLVLSRLSSASEQPLWVVPTGGGSPLRVASILAHDATWMPDGTSILYASGNDIAVTPLAGGGSTRLATLPGRAFWLRWSPDGRVLRFTLIDPTRHTRSLWEMKSDGKGPHPLDGLGKNYVAACCGVWTSDGAYIFQEEKLGTSDLWEIRRHGLGTDLTQLTNGPLGYFSPVPARSGHRIFFLGSDAPSELQRFDPERHEFRPVMSFLANASRAEYSRDGRWVAWRDSTARLWRARPDGSEMLQLTPPEVEVFSAAWSPDGTTLALMARLPGRAWQIYQLDASGGEMKQMVNESRNAADPTWSSDGRFVAFGREPDLMGEESGSHSIQTLEVATGHISVLPNSEGLFSPRWSPDGRWIAALTRDQKKVMLYDTITQQWKVLATTSAADPVWTRDGKSLYVHAYLADKQPILRITVPDGQMQTIADLTDLRTRDGANYFFGGLSADNQPLVLPRVGTSNLYRLDLDL